MAKHIAVALLICGCTTSWQMDVRGTSAPPPPPPPAHAQQAPPEEPQQEAAPVAEPAVVEAPAPPVDPALRKRARRIAAHVETLLEKMATAFTSAKGQCNRVAANLRVVTKQTKRSRAEIQRALTDAERDEAFAAEWEVALAELSERTEAKYAEAQREAQSCQYHPAVVVAIEPLRLRIFKKHAAPRPAAP